MTPQELKNSILQLAIQGKLVEQRPEEGTAAELLEKILAERYGTNETRGTNGTAKTNGTKRRASSVSEVSSVSDVLNVSGVPSDEKPFDIPESWEWVRLGEVISLLSGRDLEPSKYSSSPKKYPYMTGASNFDNGNLLVNRWTDCPVTISHSGDLLITCKGTVGAMAFNVVGDIHIARQIMAISSESVYLNYVKVFLEYSVQSLKAAANSMIPGIDRKTMLLRLIPLPPLAEQKRIVAKIEELMPLVDRYEKAWSRLEDFNKRFPADMQKSLLQLAIQGKLVEQRPEEGTGEELYRRLKSYHSGLKPCKDELDYSSMNFTIPANWTMIELNQLFDFVDYRGKTPNKTTSGVFLITASNIRQAYMDYTRKEYISREEYKGRQSRGLTQKGDLLFTTEAPMGNAALCDLDECSCGQRIITFKEYAEGTAYPALYMYFILSPQFQQQLLDNCTGTTAKGIKADKLKHFLIPLPPLAEQKRIVAKLEELLPLCERLKSESNSAANS